MKVAFYIIGKKWVVYDTSWNQGHIQGKIKQWNIWRKINFSQKKSKSYYLSVVWK